MAISPQLLTIYLYSTHRAVIFAIAQLSCYSSYCRLRALAGQDSISNLDVIHKEFNALVTSCQVLALTVHLQLNYIQNAVDTNKFKTNIISC